MTAPVLIHSARRVAQDGVIADAWVRFEGDSVADAGVGEAWRVGLGPGADVVDAEGRWLTPGFIDLHCHGGGGLSIEDGPDGILSLLNTHSPHGTTRSVCSLVSAPLEQIEKGLASIALAAERDPRVLGAHLEGPFLNEQYRGAHDRGVLRDADRASIDRLLSAAPGRIVQVTLAPERAGGLEAIREFTDAGVLVAVGHTGANFDAALAAFDAGAGILTHAFNGMRGLHHRAPGPVAAAMRSQHVTLEVINDGVHVHPDIVRLAFRGARDRIALITDAMAAAGAADGEYLLGSLPVTVAHGVARLSDGGSIAGSTLTQDDALRRAVGDCGIPIVEAVGALTVTPARTIGRGADLGGLEPGFAADAVLLDDALTVEAVWSAGRRLR